MEQQAQGMESGWDGMKRWPDGTLMSRRDERFLKLQSGQYDPDSLTMLDMVMLARPSLFIPGKLRSAAP